MYKNNKQTILIPLIVALSLVSGVLLSRFVFNDTPRPAPRARLLSAGGGKIDMLLSLIGNRYVDTVSVDSITERIMPMILEELDPHSTYIPAKDFQAVNESLDGRFEGIGITFNMATDTVIVLSVIPAGPSDKAGVQPGDRIVTINDTVVAGVEMNQDAVVKRLRGPKGTQVALGIDRVGLSELVPISVTRDVIPVKCIMASYMLRPGIGYVVFSQFTRHAHLELTAAVEMLKAQGMTRLILDIRSNPGGFLDQAIVITNEFLPAERLIVFTRDRHGNEEKQYSNGQGRFQDLEIDILVDERSASSSEILAGALQDNDRGTIYGRRTFGKGLVQEQIEFPDKSAVQLTIARYYTPSGRSIQKPYDKGGEDYFDELYTRYEHDEYFTADSIHFDDSLRYTTVGGRTVYGGGGIMPDVFVPADTTGMSAYYRKVNRLNLLYKFTIAYSDRHRQAINAIDSFEALDAFFAADPGLFNSFVQYAARNGVPANASQIRTSRALMLSQLRAYIGRNTPLEENAFYRELEATDNVIGEVLAASETE